jgi:hypothetical protein
MINEEKLKSNIKEELLLLDEALIGLKKSFIKCNELLDKENKTFENLESIDSIIIKFARISDIYTQKILTSVIILSLEKTDGFIDKVNICEKLGVIDSASSLSTIREIRNYTSHEYAPSMVNAIFKNIMQSIPILLKNIELTKKYLKNKFDIC